MKEESVTAATTALRLLTRLPLPTPDDHNSNDGKTADWFPLAGIVIGILLASLAAAGTTLLHLPHQATAFLLLLAWVAITGALHLDGAADLADALGAAHRDPNRMLEVMRDPHTGSFGVVTITLLLVGKLTLIDALLLTNSLTTPLLLLTPVWARLGALIWLRRLPALRAEGMAFSCTGSGNRYAIPLWGGACTMLGAAGVSIAFSAAAWLFLVGWLMWLRHRLGGTNGDTLGAGIEVCECGILLAGLLLMR